VTTKINLGPSNAVGNGDGSFQSSRSSIREYDFWITRFQGFSGPDFLTRARRAIPGALPFEPLAVSLALAMQRKRDKALREQGTCGLIELAAAGVNLAKYNLALQRQSTPSEHASVFELMRAVADTETADTYLKGLAITGLGECYLFGHGVERDAATAHELFERGAEYGVGEAAFHVGLYHDDKEYDPYRGPVDFEKAARYYQRGAELGHVPSMTHLGILFATHRLGADKAEAAWNLLERASAAGDDVAQNVLNVLGSIEALRAPAPPAGLSSVLFRAL
jgi:TPR repeat protein